MSRNRRRDTPQSPDGPKPPPHRLRREEPLPQQKPKPAKDDPDAPRRLRALLEHPAYRQADHDPDFLQLDATRGVRLQIDYLKAELLLEEAGVEHTIVVFGSTRVPEPSVAAERVERLKAELAADPENRALAQRLAIAERIAAKSVYYDVAREFGRLVGACSGSSDDCRIMLMTGGGPGLMEAANRGAFDVDAKTIGLNITLPLEQYPNPYLTPEFSFRFHYFAIRKLHFLLRARALVTFPGGFGTLDELFETLTLVQTRTIDPVPVVLIGEQYWRRVFDIDFLVAEGVIAAEDRELFWYSETAEDAWRTILEWHEANGTPLL